VLEVTLSAVASELCVIRVRLKLMNPWMCAVFVYSSQLCGVPFVHDHDRRRASVSLFVENFVRCTARRGLRSHRHHHHNL